MTDQHHPLTDEIIAEKLITTDECLRRLEEGRTIYYEEDFRVGADWQLEQVLRWFQFDYGTDPNLSRERKMRGGFKEIATALEKAMRPTGVLKALAGTGREGALNALDRLYEENDKGLRRLAQEDN